MNPVPHDAAIAKDDIRLAIDIGGTFTDICLDRGGEFVSAKVLTTPRSPEKGVIDGVEIILKSSGVGIGDIAIVVHGTTLATNAIIERRGARSAFIVTRGFRDSLEIGYEHRFEQYDLNMVKPAPLVPRNLRFEIEERVDARGRMLLPLDEKGVRNVAHRLLEKEVESVAVGYMHAYVNGDHERRTRDILREIAPDLAITLASEVCPEIREYERWSTTVANAYVQPIMDRYLGILEKSLVSMGLRCPLLLMTSGGGLTTVETARRFPIRLVESGPAGGAMLASAIAAKFDIARTLSFDMGGTTAKLCLIDDAEPQYSRSFEVAREYRFLKGSGLPLKIPVIEMVEIGAGGGSIASVDSLSRVNVGPHSAAAEPGPACYGRGGDKPTVTDANLILGKIDPHYFAGGSIALSPDRAGAAMKSGIGDRLGLSELAAAASVCEIVEENMANAARVHAMERGKHLESRTIIAFGGAAPLHASRIAEKLNIGRVLIPARAGVGSAVGFLVAPVSYEVVRSRHTLLDPQRFDVETLNALCDEMRAEALKVVRAGAPDGMLTTTTAADMRYRGQGHEITVRIPDRPFGADTCAELARLFEEAYAAAYGRIIPGLTVEVINWTLRTAAAVPSVAKARIEKPQRAATAGNTREMFDFPSGRLMAVSVYRRDSLAADEFITGPAVIVEDETTTVVGERFHAFVCADGSLILERASA